MVLPAAWYGRAEDGHTHPVIRPSLAATFACTLLVLTVGLRSQLGFTWFVHGGGYTDAPIFYAIAHDADWGVARLELRHMALGLAYRYQRILYPVLARLLGAGISEFAAFGLVAVNVVAVAMGTGVLSWWAQRHSASPAWGWLFPCSLGFLTVLFFDLSEGLLWALLFGALLAYDQGHIRATALFLTLALFTKETALIVVLAIGLAALLQKRWSDVIWLALPVGLFGVFQLLLLVWFGQPGLVGSSTQVDLVPFLGAYTVPDIVAPKSVNELVYLTVTVVIPTVIAALWSLWTLRQRYSVVAVALFLNCVQVALMSPWSWTGFIHYGRLSMGVPLLLTWMALERRSRVMAALALVQTILALALLPFIIVS